MTNRETGDPALAVQLVQWQKHGDHPAVEPYGPSLLDHYPVYAACGVLPHDYQYQHVAPGSWIATLPNGTSRVLTAGNLERELEALVASANQMAVAA